MFLRPQHFQAADRYWSEQLQVSEQWDHAYGYGIHHIEFSHESIANFHFQVHSCQVRLKDGTLVSLTGGEEADRVEIKAAPFRSGRGPGNPGGRSEGGLGQ